jgi:hypothetical protein
LRLIEPGEDSPIAEEFGINVNASPRGFVAGTVEIADCEPLKPEHGNVAFFATTKSTAGFAWLLKNPRRSNVS